MFSEGGRDMVVGGGGRGGDEGGDGMGDGRSDDVWPRWAGCESAMILMMMMMTMMTMMMMMILMMIAFGVSKIEMKKNYKRKKDCFLERIRFASLRSSSHTPSVLSSQSQSQSSFANTLSPPARLEARHLVAATAVLLLHGVDEAVGLNVRPFRHFTDLFPHFLFQFISCFVVRRSFAVVATAIVAN